MKKTNGNGRRNGRHPRAGGRPKIDWNAARSWFARQPERSYVDVAERFGVSDTAVRNHAKAEDWEGYRADVMAATARRRREADIRALEERQADTIRLVDELREVVFENVDVLDPTAVMRALPRWLRHEQLIAGEATDRISLAEMDALQRAYHDFILELVAASERGERVSADQIPERLRAHLEQSLEATNGEVAA